MKVVVHPNLNVLPWAMFQLKEVIKAWATVFVLCITGYEGKSADVSSYSILKGHFLIQTGPTTLISDPDLGFSMMAFVEATDYDLITNATLRLPDGSTPVMEDDSYSWGILDTFNTLATLNAAYPGGTYTMGFGTANDGIFSCALTMPNTSLPPMPRLVNYDAIQAVDPSAPLALTWDYSSPPKSNDFVQVYINLGHGEVFSTPNIGEPGALDYTSRKVTVPPNSMESGYTYNLNIEITRLFATNSTSYPDAEGLVGMFSSTSIDFTPLWPPILFGPSVSEGTFSIDVLADPQTQVVLQTSPDLKSWADYATNISTSISNLFTLPKGTASAQFFRARQQ